MSQNNKYFPMISINPPYTQMIFETQTKGFEFRNKLINSIYPNNKMIVYETINKKGSGKVIGEFTIEDIYPVIYPINFIIDHCFDNLDLSGDNLVYFIDSRLSVLQKNQNVFADKLYKKYMMYIDINSLQNTKQNFEIYLNSIGYGKSKYAICIDNPMKYYVSLNNMYSYSNPKCNLNNYISSKNKIVVRPPQNIFNVTYGR